MDYIYIFKPEGMDRPRVQLRTGTPLDVADPDRLQVARQVFGQIGRTLANKGFDGLHTLTAHSVSGETDAADCACTLSVKEGSYLLRDVWKTSSSV